jgi:hypothetical protein
MNCHLVDIKGKPCTNLVTYEGCYIYCNNHKHLISKSKVYELKQIEKRLDSYDKESLHDLVTIYDSIFNFSLKHIKKNGLK